jgi:hydrogenase maturation factor
MAFAIPQYLTLGVYYPPGTSEKWLENNMRQLGKAARALGIRILGGHTGGYDGLTLPIISSTCLGFLSETTRPPRTIKPKDVLIAVGPIGRETLWFLANVEPEEVDTVVKARQRKRLAKDLSPFDVVSVANSLSQSNILLMHDLAEGGLATAVTELCRAAGLGLVIQYDTIPWDKNIIQLCTKLGWNPLFCSSFGSFLIITTKDEASPVMKELNQLDRPAALIGEFTANQQLLLDQAGKVAPLPKGDDPYRDYTSKIA